MNYLVKNSSLKGMLTVPPSKSHTLRAILFASMAEGKSIIRNYLQSPDTQAMIKACQQLGAQVFIKEQQLEIVGVAGKPKTPDNIIDAGNSGQVLRFITAVTALTSKYSVITGDNSIRTNRPIVPLLKALNDLNVFAVSTKGDGFAPVVIKGPLSGGVAHLDGQDSQPVSGLLIAAAFASNPTELFISEPGERPWVDLTLNWFKQLGIEFERKDYGYYKVFGRSAYSGFDYTVPGDFSSCAFPLIAALITGSEVQLNGLNMQDVQGDKALIFVLQTMNAQIEFDAKVQALRVKKTPYLTGCTINVNDFIDAVPILAVAGCFAEGETCITGAAIARTKESNRLACMVQELSKMGAQITEHEDGLYIKQSDLKGARVQSHADHRIAMALTTAALAAKGETVIEDIACITKSYPQFASDLQRLGAYIELISS